MKESKFTSTYCEQLIALMYRYGFDLEGLSPDSLVSAWLEQYPNNWIYLAVLEALHQGRYKIVSVEQILKLWLRRRNPTCHFNEEFESLITGTISEQLSVNLLTSSVIPEPEKEIKEEKPVQVKQLCIGQFIPVIDGSPFYNRLKALAEQNVKA